MPASHETIDKLYSVMKKHLSCKQLNAIVLDLTSVPGNASFRESIMRLQKLHADEQRRRSHAAESGSD